MVMIILDWIFWQTRTVHGTMVVLSGKYRVRRHCDEPLDSCVIVR